ncbi:hypothetical protein ACFQ8C_27825 [Streptomyces sp. NPDC056503]
MKQIPKRARVLTGGAALVALGAGAPSGGLGQKFAQAGVDALAE